MNHIELKSVSKNFKIGFNKKKNLLSKVFYSLSGLTPEKNFWALKDISLEIDSGKIVGIVGKNGSGKTTLLRTIAGIYKNEKGIIKVNGKIISLIGLQLAERLSMNENIFLFCSLYGLTKKETKKKFYRIVKFAELEEFTNTKIYQFSSGMAQRLAISILFHCNPDILLLDDIDITVDKTFLNKCIKKGKELTKKGKIILFASHSTKILQVADEIIWLENGKIKEKGGTKRVLKKYLLK